MTKEVIKNNLSDFNKRTDLETEKNNKLLDEKFDLLLTKLIDFSKESTEEFDQIYLFFKILIIQQYKNSHKLNRFYTNIIKSIENITT